MSGAPGIHQELIGTLKPLAAKKPTMMTFIANKGSEAPRETIWVIYSTKLKQTARKILTMVVTSFSNEAVKVIMLCTVM